MNCLVQGFTTNPSLMKKGGVKSYKEFSKKVLEKIKDVPVSFEVFTNDLDTMYKEALELQVGEKMFMLKYQLWQLIKKVQ